MIQIDQPLTKIYKVYTREGSYVGHETSPSAWTLATEQSNVEGEGFYSITELDLFSESIQLDAGSTQSFYVVSSKKNLLTKPFSTNGILYSSNDVVSFNTGPSSGDAEFQTTRGAYIMNGGIRYCVR